MIIEYPPRKARCKDCVYCGSYRPIRRNGEESKRYKYKCRIRETDILLSDFVCDDWKMGNGIPRHYIHIEKP